MLITGITVIYKKVSVYIENVKLTITLKYRCVIQSETLENLQHKSVHFRKMFKLYDFR